MYNLIPPLILILSLAGLIIFFVRKFSRAVTSSQEEEMKKEGEFLGTAELRIFTYQKKVLIVVERILGVFVALAMKTAMGSSRLLGKVKIRSREVHKASDFVTAYLEKLKKRKHTEDFSTEEEDCINLIKENPSNTEAYKRLGNNYFARENYRDAKLSFEQALRLNPNDEETKARIGQMDEMLEESGGSEGESNRDEPA